MMATNQDIELLKHELELQEQLFRLEAKESFQKFVQYTYDGYSMQWFHKLICHYLDKLYKGDIKKLMIFVPPQHGKSELSSRRFPAYLLGRDPNLKLAVCSYTADLANSFNEATQKIIQSKSYQELFPNSKIGGKDGKANSKQFNVNNHSGFLKAVGVGGSLTGTPVDIGIIDDPFKDRLEANSETYRKRTWEWYQDVFCTRMHNDSKQLMLFTRWHEDDLAGRLLDPTNKCYNEREAKEWTVIALPALKESIKPLECAIDINDPREIGEALWEERHSREKYERRREINPTGFASLDQQRPAPLEGDMIKEEWLTILTPNELPFNIDDVTWDLWIDGAWTDKKKNDETAVSCTYYDKRKRRLYIRNVTGVRKEISDLIDYLKEHSSLNGYTKRSSVNVEMKSSGFAIKKILFDEGYNTIPINSKVVSLGKKNRVELCEPYLASGRVFLIKEQGSSWIPSFLAQCKAFPNGANDDKVDVLAYPIIKYFMKNKTGGVTYN
ncbi:MAG: terminase family protein [Arenibacter latericius]|nr:terminase family protein [Arenibacter latericius]